MLSIGYSPTYLASTLAVPLEEQRLCFHSDYRIPSIETLSANQPLSLLQQLKVKMGAWKNVQVLSEKGELKSVFISIKKLAKETGLSPSQVPAILKIDTFTRMNQIATLILAGTEIQKLNPTEFYKAFVQTNASDLFSKDLEPLSSTNITLANEDKRIHILAIQEKVNQGLDSCVWRVNSLFHKESLIFKESKSIFHPKHPQLEDSFKLLNKLNPNGRVVGLQKPYISIIEIRNGEKATSRCGFLSDMYTGNMKELSLSLVELKQAAHQLSSGLNHLHRLHYFHGDIKPSNCLYSTYRYDIADCDQILSKSAIRLHLLAHAKAPSAYTFSRIWSTSTFSYACSEDEAALRNLIEQFESKSLSLAKAETQIMQLMKARDAYALAKTIKHLTEKTTETNPLSKEDEELATLELILDSMMLPSIQDRLKGFTQLQKTLKAFQNKQTP